MDRLTEDMRATYWQDRSTQQYVGLSICTALVVVASILRFIAQHKVRHLRSLDNFFCVPAAISTIALLAVTFYAVAHGGGIHIWRILLNPDGSVKPDGLDALMHYHYGGWACSWVWAPSYSFIKLSILAFLWRIFSARGKLFRGIVIGMALFTIAYGIASTFEFIFQCLPVYFFWQRALIQASELFNLPMPHVSGKCLPQLPHVAVPFLLGTVSDVALLLLPLLAIWNLQLSRRKKAGVLFTLSLGVFAIGLDIVRLIDNFKLQNSGDITWNDTPGLIFNAVEFSIAYVCMCVPAMAPLLRDDDRKKEMERYYIAASAERANNQRRTRRQSCESLTELNNIGGVQRTLEAKQHDAESATTTVTVRAATNSEHSKESLESQIPDGIEVVRTFHVSRN